MTLTLKDISKRMRDIDFTMLSTRAEAGQIAARPMSNNRDVDYDGTSWFFALEETNTIRNIERDPKVGLSLQGSKSLLGAPGIFISIEANARLVRDKQAFRDHWVKDLDSWFEQGIDTPGLVLIQARADRIHYWDGKDEGEIVL
ncbi:general stress protein 26 [Rhodoligotrophos appendicifer]|uniref:pyridoxamine 5'-phosphate oxidase family protein n=1 Tax=Rhodoligotrophos appendicifer TaxID=987056 RepID=UPI001180CA48|nr:pyridoxamine 5'-phosphate oxidase family protein [Rhodoligotrophos appendicifer]